MNNERQIKINEQIAEAVRVIKKFSYKNPALIMSSKLKPSAKNEFFGFRFAVNESCKVGDVIKNTDGSIDKIEAIITPKQGA
jgi:hypothetical protein